MNYFSYVFGLVTKLDPTTENGGLFFAHYLVLKLMLGQPITAGDAVLFNTKMADARVAEGLYLRSKHHTERTVSHDEITGMIVASKILKTKHSQEIWKYLVEHDGRYDATGVPKGYSPANHYAWGLLNGDKFTWLFAPLYTINFYISINKDKTQTSSKLIYLQELYLMKDESIYARRLWNIFKKKMKEQYGEYWIKELFAIYFWSESEDHPLIELSRKVCDAVDIEQL